MKITDFDFSLPPELVAQEPAREREDSRLMTVDRLECGIGDTTFRQLPNLLREGDLLVVNDTRVIPARLLGRKLSGGRTEVFLVRRRPQDGEVWECLLRCSKPPRPGMKVFFEGNVFASVIAKGEGETWEVRFEPAESFFEWLETFGSVPLPPYIVRAPEEKDRQRYQTVFAQKKGAVAAPTAGLHFTDALLNRLRSTGVHIVPLTLHVGLGTFMPVRVENLFEHKMHRERYYIPEPTAAAVNAAKCEGRRVIAVGTTTTRALEYAAASDGTLAAGDGEADIFIYPGYRFKVVDALITNFHLPKSTLLMLVSAFAGKDLLFTAYDRAVKEKFRFFSYGDAMFIY